MQLHKNKYKNQGFTLLELLIVVFIVSILASVALPAYLDAVRASHRTDAQITMQRIAMSLERYYTTNSSLIGFTLISEFGNNCVPQVLPCNAGNTNVRYIINLSIPTATTYSIRADAVNNQSVDKCGGLTLDHTNTKTVIGAAPGYTVDNCW